MNPLVTVIIPVYNGARYLNEALCSIAAQTYRPLEITIVDDGSTDESRQLVNAARERLNIPLSYHYQSNQGPSAARNLGVDRTNGELIAFLDADDVWLPQKLWRQVAYLRAESNQDGVVCRLTYILEKEQEWQSGLSREYFDNSPAGFLPSALMVWREAFSRVGNFDPALRTGEDTDWFLRAREGGVRIGLVPEILLQRRFHQSNLSHTPQDQRKQMFALLRKSIKRKSS
ncbi:MAG: glycosyltransferase family 2 protein [bacterium]|nr:glycosyltransferase family 2 protein [bacterium]